MQEWRSSWFTCQCIPNLSELLDTSGHKTLTISPELCRRYNALLLDRRASRLPRRDIEQSNLGRLGRRIAACNQAGLAARSERSRLHEPLDQQGLADW